MGFVWDSCLPHNLKLVALAYADHADHDGRNIFPSVPLVARKTGYTERQVQVITRKLTDLGVLVEDGTGFNHVRRWRMDVSALSLSAVDNPVDNSARGGEEISPPEGEGVKFTTLGGEEISPKPPIEPSLVVVVGSDPLDTLSSKNSYARTRARAHATPSPAELVEADLEAAFDKAGIINPSTRAEIRAAWPDVQAIDILAWSQQRYADNLNMPHKRQMGVGAMVVAMKAGRRAREECYQDVEDGYRWNILE